jgi:hypothetical protein
MLTRPCVTVANHGSLGHDNSFPFDGLHGHRQVTKMCLCRVLDLRLRTEHTDGAVGSAGVGRAVDHFVVPASYLFHFKL